MEPEELSDAHTTSAHLRLVQSKAEATMSAEELRRVASDADYLVIKTGSKSAYTRDQRIYKMLLGWYWNYAALDGRTRTVFAIYTAVLFSFIVVCGTTVPLVMDLFSTSGERLSCRIESYTITPLDAVAATTSSGAHYGLPKVQLNLFASINGDTSHIKPIYNTGTFISHAQAVESGETYTNSTFKCYRRLEDQRIILGDPIAKLNGTGILFAVTMTFALLGFVTSCTCLLGSKLTNDGRLGNFRLRRQLENIGLGAPTYDKEYTKLERMYDSPGPWMPHIDEIQQVV
jgi:hypothetical protein